MWLSSYFGIAVNESTNLIVLKKKRESVLNLIDFMDWMFVSPPNSYVGILLGGKDFSKWLGLDEVMRVRSPEWD